MASVRKLLFPFSILYGSIMHVRNKFYDRGLLSSREFELPVIAVGNLSVGGTGKSPMVEYLVNILKTEHKVATLSRGYKRKSSGYILLNGQETATEVGDEPLQFKSKFRDVLVAVDESRSNGIVKLLEETPSPDVVILDDAFQHRKVKAGFYILLTSYTNLYRNDMVLPAGNLREPALGAKRANIIVVTKCPEDLSASDQEEIKRKLRPQGRQEVYFSSITYSNEVFSRNRTLELKALQKEPFTLVTGIARPQPLVDHLERQGLIFTHKAFSDHHNFTEEEIKALQHEELILTTEKDYMRLKNEISREKIFFLPIKTRFLNRGADFDEQIRNFVKKK